MSSEVGVLHVIRSGRSVVSACRFENCVSSPWWLAFFGGIISVIFGLICVFFAFGVLQVSAIIMGIMMIVDSIITIVVTIRSSIALKNMAKENPVPENPAPAKDVESKVVEDDKN